MKVLHLLDGSSFIYRSFFALPDLSTKDGFPTGAIYGTLRTLLSLIKTEKPKYLAVVFDLPAPSKREKVYSRYKAGRRPAPDPLKVQIPVIRKLIGLMGIPTVEKEGYEADDLIAVLAKRFSERSFKVKIYTPDKDLLQLVNEKVTVINPMSREVFTRDKVVKKFGVPPERIPDLLALAGDKIDNIEGIKGVGQKTAVKIIGKYGGVKEILDRWEEFKKEYPQANREILELSYYLVKPLLDAELDLSEEDLKLRRPDLKELLKELRRLEMKSLIKDVENLFMKNSSQGSLF